MGRRPEILTELPLLEKELVTYDPMVSVSVLTCDIGCLCIPPLFYDCTLDLLESFHCDRLLYSSVHVLFFI